MKPDIRPDTGYKKRPFLSFKCLLFRLMAEKDKLERKVNIMGDKKDE